MNEGLVEALFFRPEIEAMGDLRGFQKFLLHLRHQAFELSLFQAYGMLTIARLFPVTCQYGIQQNCLPSLLSRTTRKG
jgi:hypothetical protein